MAKQVVQVPAELEDALAWLDAAKNPDKYVSFLKELRDLYDDLEQRIAVIGKIDKIDAHLARARAAEEEAVSVKVAAGSEAAALREQLRSERESHDRSIAGEVAVLARDLQQLQRDKHEFAEMSARHEADHRNRMAAAQTLMDQASQLMTEAQAAKADYEDRLARIDAIRAGR